MHPAEAIGLLLLALVPPYALYKFVVWFSRALDVHLIAERRFGARVGRALEPLSAIFALLVVFVGIPYFFFSSASHALRVFNYTACPLYAGPIERIGYCLFVWKYDPESDDRSVMPFSHATIDYIRELRRLVDARCPIDRTKREWLIAAEHKIARDEAAYAMAKSRANAVQLMFYGASFYPPADSVGGPLDATLGWGLGLDRKAICRSRLPALSGADVWPPRPN